MHQREDRGIGADPQGDGEYDRGGKSRRLLELAQGEFEIVHG